jgi:Leucine-rich repeat (LRR) protein
LITSITHTIVILTLFPLCPQYTRI